ncbi:MAG: hypothetical protein LBL87_05750 [Ruminococcus sp.]|jgi:hypothetical protein|nr:hypothetical protein [Ruminococcus sp.]
MKCNHCDNEAVYSEDFSITESYMTDEQTAQQKQLENKRMRNTLLFGGVGGYLLSDNNDVAPTEKLIGFVREYVCEDCYKKYHERLNQLKEKLKPRKIALYICIAILLVLGIGGLLISLLGGSDNIMSVSIIVTFISVLGCIIFGARCEPMNSDVKLLTERIAQKRTCPDYKNEYVDLYESGKAPLMNMVNIPIKPSESFDDICEKIFNSPHLNDPLAEERIGTTKIISTDYTIDSMKEGANVFTINEFTKNVYSKLLKHLTAADEETRIELLHSRLK